jgi:hypothetical protein
VGTRPVACQPLSQSTTRVRVEKTFVTLFVPRILNQIKNHHQERDCTDHKSPNEKDNDFHGPYYDQPAHPRSLIGGRNVGGIKPFSRDLKRVR